MKKNETQDSHFNPLSTGLAALPLLPKEDYSVPQRFVKVPLPSFRGFLMKKNHFRLFPAMLAVLALAACLGLWLSDYLGDAPLPGFGQTDKAAGLGKPSGQAAPALMPPRLPQIAPAAADSGRPFVLPPAPPNPARLGAAQKRQAVAQARQDAEAAALAAGQTEALAAEAGQAAAAAAEEAAGRPSAIGGAP